MGSEKIANNGKNCKKEHFKLTKAYFDKFEQKHSISFNEIYDESASLLNMLLLLDKKNFPNCYQIILLKICWNDKFLELHTEDPCDI